MLRERQRRFGEGRAGLLLGNFGGVEVFSFYSGVWCLACSPCSGDWGLLWMAWKAVALLGKSSPAI